MSIDSPSSLILQEKCMLQQQQQQIQLSLTTNQLQTSYPHQPTSFTRGQIPSPSKLSHISF